MVVFEAPGFWTMPESPSVMRVPEISKAGIAVVPSPMTIPLA